MILVTGLSGKSGKWFLRKMENDRSYFEVKGIRAITRKKSSLDMLMNSKIKIDIVVGETGNEEVVRKAMKNVDIVFHNAGIHTSRTIAKIAIELNVKWLILVHTTGIYSKYKAAGEEYRQTERYIEELAKGKETKITIIRPTMVFGSINDNNMIVFIRMVERMRLFPIVSGGKYEIQPISEKDLGEAYYAIIKNEQKTKGKNYILSGKGPIELIQVFKEIAEILKVNNKFISIPFPVAYSGAFLIWILTIGKIDYREKVQRLVEPRVFSHEEAYKDFQFNPMSFREAITIEINEYLGSKNNPTTAST